MATTYGLLKVFATEKLLRYLFIVKKLSENEELALPGCFVMDAAQDNKYIKYSWSSLQKSP